MNTGVWNGSIVNGLLWLVMAPCLIVAAMMAFVLLNELIIEPVRCLWRAAAFKRLWQKREVEKPWPRGRPRTHGARASDQQLIEAMTRRVHLEIERCDKAEKKWADLERQMRAVSESTLRGNPKA